MPDMAGNGEVDFNTMYKALNERQREAVDAIEGPVMVVAGPGTGKTQILTLRIANILRQTDTPPDAILALTFTNAGVYAMRKRLLGIIGQAAHKVRIHTFHSFCNETIERYPEYFPRIIGGKNASQPIRYQIIERLIDEGGFSIIRPSGDPYYYVSDIVRSISELKRDYINPDAFEELLAVRTEELENDPEAYHQKGRWVGQMKGAHKDALRALEKNRELLAVYRGYEIALTSLHLYDFDDMIGEVVRALSHNSDFKLILQEEYHYILADEHQDANDAQNKILNLLSDFFDNPNLFVVGDTKQAIFRFQGASQANFLRFTHTYPTARVITLEENYRSHQTVLDAGHGLIPENLLVSKSPHPKEMITLSAHATYASEHAFLAKHIGDCIARGTSPSEIAVIYRNNSEAVDIARALSFAGIAVSIESSQDALALPSVRLLLALARAATYLGDPAALAKVLYAPFLSLPPARAHELIVMAYELRKSLVTVVEQEEPQLWQVFVGWKNYAWSLSAVDAFSAIAAESGFKEWVLGQDNVSELLEATTALFNAVREVAEFQPRATLADCLAFLETTETYGLLASNPDGDVRDRVRLMTAHRAKGREFDHVYIAHVLERRWSGKGISPKFKLPLNTVDANHDARDDERRLLYVAMTRARKALTMSYAMGRDDGTPELPSIFLDDIKKWCAYTQEPTQETDVSALFAKPIFAGPCLAEKTYIQELFERRGLSATALNNYLACPWKYFFMNLVRLPEAKPPYMGYGTAVHAALKEFFDAFTEKGTDPGSAMLVQAFERALARQPMTAIDFETFKQKGVIALEGYWQNYTGGWHTATRTEYAIKGVQFSDTILLAGSIDKMELQEDGSVIVVDYKTKQPESRNVLEGKTKNATGDIKRQLVFYRLLLEKYDGDRYPFAAGEIDFIEPTDTGKYKKERFAISDDEVRELADTITRVGEEITNLAFWATHCDDRDCRFCRLGDIVRMKKVTEK